MIKGFIYVLLLTFVITYIIMFFLMVWLNYILHGYFYYESEDAQSALSLAILSVITRFIGMLMAPSLKDKNKSQYEELAKEINEINKKNKKNKKKY